MGVSTNSSFLPQFHLPSIKLPPKKIFLLLKLLYHHYSLNFIYLNKVLDGHGYQRPWSQRSLVRLSSYGDRLYVSILFEMCYLLSRSPVSFSTMIELRFCATIAI